jgi:hypothetical protein
LIDKDGLAFGAIRSSSAVLAVILVTMPAQVHRRMQRAAASVE